MAAITARSAERPCKPADGRPMIGLVSLSLVSGFLIGCVGIGGVILVPCLTMVGVDVHAAIAASMFSFLFSGLIGVWLYAREGSVQWAEAAWLGLGAMPGALAGALLASRMEGRILLLLIGAAVVFAGLRSLMKRGADRAADGHIPAAWILVLTGAAVGLGSSVTGTGGPLLLVPLLIWLRVPVLVAVGLGQAIQVPIAALATLGNLGTGQLGLQLGLLLSGGVIVGTAVGARVAHSIPTAALTRLVAVILLIVGALVIVRSSNIVSFAAS